MCCGGKIGVAGVTQLDCVEWSARGTFPTQQNAGAPLFMCLICPQESITEKESLLKCIQELIVFFGGAAPSLNLAILLYNGQKQTH